MAVVCLHGAPRGRMTVRLANLKGRVNLLLQHAEKIECRNKSIFLSTNNDGAFSALITYTCLCL